MSEAILYGLFAGGSGALLLWVILRRLAKNPNGKCAYCGNPLAVWGPLAKVCRKCKRTQPWVNEGNPH